MGIINPLDVIVVVVVIYYAMEGYSLGFILAFFDLFGFLLSFFLALKSYAFISGFFVTFFSMHIGFAHAVAFFLVAFCSEIAINIFSRRIFRYFPTFHRRRRIFLFFRNIDHFAGIVPGVASAFIVLAFFITILVTFPSSPFIKRLVTGSEIGSILIANISALEHKLDYVFGGALGNTVND